jgi:alpha-glucosidase
MLNLRRELGLGRGSLSWAEELCSSSSLAFLNGNVLVVMNVGQDTLGLPAGEVLLRSSGGVPSPSNRWNELGSGETAWLRVSAEDAGS